MTDASFKVKAVLGNGRQSAFAKYREIYYGNQSIGRIILAEVLTTLIGWIPGALGLLLRKFLYPLLFRTIGRNVVFGRSLTLRHAHKILIGDDVVIDDNCVIDAKGYTNVGITIGRGVYVGRNSIIYCKDGDIDIADEVNISSNCQIYSSRLLSIGKGTMIGAFSYLLSGGDYDYTSSQPFADQAATESHQPVSIGPNCWLAARVTVLNGATVGEHCVIGACSLVTKAIPDNKVAVGVPARVIRATD